MVVRAIMRGTLCDIVVTLNGVGAVVGCLQTLTIDEEPGACVVVRIRKLCGGEGLLRVPLCQKRTNGAMLVSGVIEI
jgi:hypothetical protein